MAIASERGKMTIHFPLSTSPVGIPDIYGEMIGVYVLRVQDLGPYKETANADLDLLYAIARIVSEQPTIREMILPITPCLGIIMSATSGEEAYIELKKLVVEMLPTSKQYYFTHTLYKTMAIGESNDKIDALRTYIESLPDGTFGYA